MPSSNSDDHKTYFRLLAVALIILFIIITVNMTGLKNPATRLQYVYKSEVVTSSVPVDVCKQNRTLVIVTGEVRTLGLLWRELLLNIVQPNDPCDVIFSIDGRREDISKEVISGLGSRVIAILTTEEENTDKAKEFWLTKRTIRKIAFNRYHFILKTRTDLYHGVRIPLRTVFGESNDFILSFHAFHQALMKKTAQANITAGETLYAWVMTSGMIEFIQPMLLEPRNSPWSLLHTHDWNKNLKATLINCSITENLVMDSENAENNQKIARCFATTLQKHKVLYNIGSTWVQYGHSQHMISSALQLVDTFGTHTWADVGFNDNQTHDLNQWKQVTESQMRLTYLKGGYNLIDLGSDSDYEQTFRPKTTFQEARLDKRLLFFLVRNRTVAI